MSDLDMKNMKNSWFYLNFELDFHWFSLILSEVIIKNSWFSMNFNQGVVQELIDFLWIFHLIGGNLVNFQWFSLNFQWFSMNFISKIADFELKLYMIRVREKNFCHDFGAAIISLKNIFTGWDLHDQILSHFFMFFERKIG